MKLVVFDLDGVVFKIKDFWNDVNKAFKTESEYKELAEKYMYMDYDYFIREVITNLWKGKDAANYLDLISSYEYYPGAKETFKAIRDKGMKIALITTCSKELAERAKKDLGADYILCNSFEIKNNIVTGRYDWPIGMGGDKKAIALYELCEKEKFKTSDLVVVGNEEEDLEMLQMGTISIGFEAIQNIKDIVAHSVEGNLKSILKFIP